MLPQWFAINVDAAKSDCDPRRREELEEGRVRPARGEPGEVEEIA